MWRNKMVTDEGQRRMLEEVIAVYRGMGIAVQSERKTVPIHSIIATQNAIEADKFEVVIELVGAGKLVIPVIVEEHFMGERYERYLIDGHCRTRARIELGERTSDAYVLWSPAGDWRSNFVGIAAQYGNVLVKDLPLV